MSDQQSDTHTSMQQDGYTALIWAVQQGNADMVMLLLDYGVQRDIADKVSYYDCVGHVVDDDDQGGIGKKEAKNKSGFFKTICAALA
jgi:ankyrin repeat protein